MATKAYGFRCKKCDRVVDDTQARCLVYAPNLDEAVNRLQDAIKEHDVSAHPDDQRFPAFALTLFHALKGRSR